MEKRRIRRIAGMLFVCTLSLIAACSADETRMDPSLSEANAIEMSGQESVKQHEIMSIPEPTVTPVPTATPQPTHIPAKNEGILIPADYRKMRKEAAGTVDEITYTTKDYYGTGEEVTKPAYVYLPHGYEEEKQYNVLYVMHGGGGDEREWEIQNGLSTVRLVLDNMIYYGELEPLIVVFPNGRTGEGYVTKSQDHTAFKDFGMELRNDLIPYIDAHYATYAEYNPEGYDLSVARDHRAMAGWSFGGMQTVNIGLCECLDAVSYFGVFAPGNTTYSAEEIAKCLERFENHDVHYIYSICGSMDGCLALAHGAFVDLPKLSDKVVNGENLMMQIVSGAHTPTIGHLGFYNFLQILFR